MARRRTSATTATRVPIHGDRVRIRLKHGTADGVVVRVRGEHLVVDTVIPDSEEPLGRCVSVDSVIEFLDEEAPTGGPRADVPSVAAASRSPVSDAARAVAADLQRVGTRERMRIAAAFEKFADLIDAGLESPEETPAGDDDFLRRCVEDAVIAGYRKLGFLHPEAINVLSDEIMGALNRRGLR
jgi:hypothetical protein